jgi:hypothetical protein
LCYSPSVDNEHGHSPTAIQFALCTSAQFGCYCEGASALTEGALYSFTVHHTHGHVQKARLIDALTTYYDSRGQMFTEGNDSIVDNEVVYLSVNVTPLSCISVAVTDCGRPVTSGRGRHTHNNQSCTCRIISFNKCLQQWHVQNNSHMSLDDSHRSTVNSIISNDMSYTGGTTVQAQHVDQPLSSEDDVPTTPTVVQRQQVGAYCVHTVGHRSM